MSALRGEISEVIEVGELFPGAISRPIAAKNALINCNLKELPPVVKWHDAMPSRLKKCKPGESIGDFYNFGHDWKRLDITKPFPTLPKNTPWSGYCLQFIGDIPLTGGQARRAGSFPDNYFFDNDYQNVISCVGNSVPPLLMKAIATQIRHKLWGGDPLTRYPKTMTYPEILEAAWQDHLKPKDPDAPTVISTFAGGGGSSLGYSIAGYRELLAVEWDDNAVATFKLNFPDMPVYHGDIAKLSVKECMTLAGIEEGELDLLDGSPPCQGFSTAGKRILNDPRNQLFGEFVRLLRGLKPKVFVMENVPGLVKGKMKLIFAEIMRELKASGYQVRCKKLNAMYFYVPQSRERLIFIGFRS